MQFNENPPTDSWDTVETRKCHINANADTNADANRIRTKNKNMSPSPSVGDKIMGKPSFFKGNFV